MSLNTTEIPQTNNIVITDRLDGLLNYHYKTCENKDVLTNHESSFRGFIQTEEGKDIVLPFSFCPEINVDNENELRTIAYPLLSKQEKYEVFNSIESTLVRVFLYKSVWHVSTSKKLDAFESRWAGSKSFGELFAMSIRHLIGITEDELSDKDRIQQWCSESLFDDVVYHFLIQTYKETRIVCMPFEYPALYLVGINKTDENGIELIECINEPSRYIRKYSEELTKNHSEMIREDNKFDLISEDAFVEDVKRKIKETNIFIHQGLIAINKHITVKFLHPSYAEGVKLRGNQPSVIYRYIELQQAGETHEKMDKFVSLYPEYFEEFCSFTNILKDISDNIFRKYRNRFVRKTVSIAPSEQYYIIRELHEQYLANKTNIVTPERVEEYIQSLPPQRIMTLYKAFLQRQKEYGHGNKINDEHYTRVENLIHSKKVNTTEEVVEEKRTQ